MKISLFTKKYKTGHCELATSHTQLNSIFRFTNTQCKYYYHYSFFQPSVLSKLEYFVCTSSRFRVAANMKEDTLFLLHMSNKPHTNLSDTLPLFLAHDITSTHLHINVKTLTLPYLSYAVPRSTRDYTMLSIYLY